MKRCRMPFMSAGKDARACAKHSDRRACFGLVVRGTPHAYYVVGAQNSPSHRSPPPRPRADL
jgi:hypothetical protein